MTDEDSLKKYKYLNNVKSYDNLYKEFKWKYNNNECQNEKNDYINQIKKNLLYILLIIQIHNTPKIRVNPFLYNVYFLQLEEYLEKSLSNFH